MGVTSVTILHTHDRKKADIRSLPSRSTKRPEFGSEVAGASPKPHSGTLTEKGFHSVLARGGVIGGSSAGATIQGSFLAHGDTTSGNTIMVGDYNGGSVFSRTAPSTNT